ncbi:endonuclease/exonuclease/phosphatase family protein [Phaeobacter marinintestinus]|uniref:endonuclease/exonuclease/phosphatase family protein n=1 Tax=Falsiphaeobacter marinintestinus TaxID=1492905 RepID=UPI0011B5489B|nr:endonuclease/exonuclease/phosphatase family protein [Phaeobacter marinintestinus]
MPFYHDLKDYDSDPIYPNKADWIARRLLTLRYDLAQSITKARRPNSLIIGSWNIRAFDGGMPRLDESFHYIAEIVSTFDICAIQELRDDLGPLKRLMRLLGPNWDYFVTDVGTHEGANYERIGFVYNKDKVFFRNVIGEIVIRSDALSDGGQIARTPFFAAFQSGWFRFTLCASHIIYGDDLDMRAQEITAITKALTKRARKEDQVFVFLGDMNIENRDDEVWKALVDSDMKVPHFEATNMKGDKFYDQIAYTEKGASTRKTRLLRHDVFDWRNAVFGPAQDRDPAAPDDPEFVTRITDAENRAHYAPINAAMRSAYGKTPYADFASQYATNFMTFEMSDHLPIWVELEVDYSDDYLARFLSDT